MAKPVGGGFAMFRPNMISDWSAKSIAKNPGSKFINLLYNLFKNLFYFISMRALSTCVYVTHARNA